MDQLTPARVAADGGAYLDELAKVADEPFAITGYCMGARLGWRIAAAHPDRVAAFAGFHGGGLVTGDAQSPHRSAGALRAEVYFGHADQDPSNSAEQIATLDAALETRESTPLGGLRRGRHGYTMADTRRMTSKRASVTSPRSSTCSTARSAPNRRASRLPRRV